MTQSDKSDTELVLHAIREDIAEKIRRGGNEKSAARPTDVARRMCWWLDDELEARFAAAVRELIAAGRIETIVPEGFGGAFIYLRPIEGE